MTEANGWASDVICAFRQGILTASELWDVLVSHMDEKDAGENVARVLGQFQTLTTGAHEISHESNDGLAGNGVIPHGAQVRGAPLPGAEPLAREPGGRFGRQRSTEELVVVLEDES